MTIFLIFLAIMAVLVGLLTLGLALLPRPFRAHPAPTHLGTRLPFLVDLPAPVARHFHQKIGDQPPEIQTAVVWGRGKANLRGVWTPLRFKAWYRAGESFSRRVEYTFFLRPVMRSGDRLTGGQGRVENGERIEEGPGIDQGQHLALWAETVWMPSVFVHDRRVRWEAEGEYSARLYFPAPGGEDNLTAYFDPLTGLMTHLAGMRYSPESEQPEPWRFDLLQWKDFHGLNIPGEVAVAWGETGAPWVYWSVDGVAYNVNVIDQLGEPGKSNS